MRTLLEAARQVPCRLEEFAVRIAYFSVALPPTERKSARTGAVRELEREQRARRFLRGRRDDPRLWRHDLRLDLALLLHAAERHSRFSAYAERRDERAEPLFAVVAILELALRRQQTCGIRTETRNGCVGVV